MNIRVNVKFNTAYKTRTGSTYPSDLIIHLNRREQILIFRLRTGHCRLGAYLYKLKVVTTPQCQCNTDHKIPEYVLQRCPTYDSIKKTHLVTTQDNGRKPLGRKRRPAADCGVRGDSKLHDQNSRSLKKLNEEEKEERPNLPNIAQE